MRITAESLGFAIKGHAIFTDVGIDVTDGEMVALTGPSGCGKTTLLNCLGLLQRPSSGTIRVDDVDATRWNDRRRTKFWRDHATFIYQDYGIIDDESVAYNVTLNARGARGEKVASVLAEVGLEGREKAAASVLSGGEKQRLGVARAMHKNASIIFADEPTASLDSANRARVIELLRERSQQGTSVVLATHDERLARSCDRTIDLSRRRSD